MLTPLKRQSIGPKIKTLQVQQAFVPPMVFGPNYIPNRCSVKQNKVVVHKFKPVVTNVTDCIIPPPCIIL